MTSNVVQQPQITDPSVSTGGVETKTAMPAKAVTDVLGKTPVAPVPMGGTAPVMTGAQVAAPSPATAKLTTETNPNEVNNTVNGKVIADKSKVLGEKINNFQAPSSSTGMSESLLNYIPSKRQMKRMTREELLVLKKFLKSHVLKEAMENRGIENIKKFAKDSVSKVTNIPDLINTFYPEFINESIDATYNVILKYADVKDSALPTLTNLNSTVKSSLDQTMNMINQSSDWISIVLSKNLSDMGMTGKIGSLTVGKFLSISALAASIVYIMTKLFKSGFKNDNTYSECVELFKSLYERKSKDFKEGIEDKLNEYINKEVPSNVITLNSLITKAHPLAQGMLFNIGYDEGNLESVPNNILILTEVCCALVILYAEILGKKFKALANKGKMKAFVSQNLLMKMGNIGSSKDIFSKLSNFKSERLEGGE